MRIQVSERQLDHFLTHSELPWASGENSEVFMKPFPLLLSTFWSFLGRINEIFNIRYSCDSLCSGDMFYDLQVNT